VDGSLAKAAETEACPAAQFKAAVVAADSPAAVLMSAAVVEAVASMAAAVVAALMAVVAVADTTNLKRLPQSKRLVCKSRRAFCICRQSASALRLCRPEDC
jgi:hypothetical protein